MNGSNSITIVVTVPTNLFETDGSTVRARSIISMIGAKYPLLIMTRSGYVDSDLLHKMNINRAELVTEGKCSKNPYLDIFFQFLWNFTIIKKLIRNEACVIYGQGIYQFPAYYLVSRMSKCLFVYDAQSLVYKETAQTSRVFALFLYLMEFVTGKLSHYIIALSGESFLFYRRLNKKVFYIPVFVDTDLYRDKQKTVRKTLNKKVGLIGPFNTKFNRYQLEFLHSNLEKFDRRITFYLIGKSDRSLHSDRVVDLGYLKTEQEYIEAISKLDALIVPVRIGTYGPKNKILEAMACSVPVFTTPQGVIGLDFVKKNESIIICEESELVTKVNDLLFDESFMNRIAINGRRITERFFSKGVLGKTLLNTLEHVLSNVS